jgi:pullulanase/glycogen debranching enzyme
MDDYYFGQSVSGAVKLSKLKTVLDESRKGGMLSVVDIVLNHTAHNS